MSTTAAADGALTGKIAHLARRAGFGMPVQGINGLAARGLDAAISYFVDYDRLPDTIPLAKPHLNDDPNNADITPLQIWWLDRMVRSERQLEEKMTLFWHGFFATSEDKVDWPSAMYSQHMEGVS